MPEDIFLKTLQSRIDYRFETYRAFIILILKVTPQVNDTTILYRCYYLKNYRKNFQQLTKNKSYGKIFP